MEEKGTIPIKPNLRTILKAAWNPTTNFGMVLKYFGILGSCAIFYSGYLKPTYKEYKFRRDEDIGRVLFEMESRARE